MSDISASGGSSVNSVNAGAAVKKAAQSVETQAQLLTTQLSNKVSKVYIYSMMDMMCNFSLCLVWCTASSALSVCCELSDVPTCVYFFVFVASFLQRKSALLQGEIERAPGTKPQQEDEDVPDFLSRLRKKQ